MSGQVSEMALVECLLRPTHPVFISNNYFEQLLTLCRSLFYGHRKRRLGEKESLGPHLEATVVLLRPCSTACYCNFRPRLKLFLHPRMNSSSVSPRHCLCLSRRSIAVGNADCRSLFTAELRGKHHVQIQTHPGVQDLPQDGPLQPEDEGCSIHCCSGHHQRQPHTWPLRYLRWTNPAGSMI